MNKELIIKKEEGVASLPVIFSLIVLILAVGIGVTAMGLSESIVSASQKNSTEALFFAEAGARDALMRIARNKNYTCDTPVDGCYQIDFSLNGCFDNEGCAKIIVSSDASPKIIVSEGRKKSSIRRVQAEVYFDASQNGEITEITWQELVD